MWRCAHCGESVEDNFEVCWKCGHTRDGSAETLPDEPPPPSPSCAACGGPMENRGVAMIHVRPEVRSLWDMLAGQEPGEWRVEVRVCADCRRIDLHDAEARDE